LFVIYILTAIAISSQRTSGLSKAKVRSKRTFYFISGLVLAIVGVSFYHLFNLVMPLFVLLIAAGTFLVWNRNKEGSMTSAGGTNFVMVPPTDKKN
jgi:Flp pilus assembly protein TadB